MIFLAPMFLALLPFFGLLYLSGCAIHGLASGKKLTFTGWFTIALGSTMLFLILRG